jgi:hypothetical protein
MTPNSLKQIDTPEGQQHAGSRCDVLSVIGPSTPIPFDEVRGLVRRRIFRDGNETSDPSGISREW